MLDLILQTFASGATPSTVNLKNLGFSVVEGEQVLDCMLQSDLNNLVHLDMT